MAELDYCPYCADEAVDRRACTCPYYCGLEGCAALEDEDEDL